jgi:hypothetical protein
MGMLKIIESSSFPINDTQHTITAAIRGHFWCPEARNQAWCISMSTASLDISEEAKKPKSNSNSLVFTRCAKI